MQTEQQPQPYPQQPAQWPVVPTVQPPGMSGGQIAFNVIILLMLLVNMGLLWALYRDVHGVTTLGGLLG